MVKQGITIVSGMAIGIDSIAHKAVLEEHGNTIAVLPCGLENIYPEENKKLFQDIINNNGLVLSEYPPKKQATSKKFLERNRIVSGLSIGVLIVEAMHRSGTSVTARYAIEQKRKVFVPPHEIGDKNGVGTNKLLKQGAIIVTKTKDIIEKNMPIDIVAVYIKDILEDLGNITGEFVTEEIINEIFSKFCLGK